MKIFDEKEYKVRQDFQNQLISLLKKLSLCKGPQENKNFIEKIRNHLLSLPLYLDRVIALQTALQTISDTEINIVKKREILYDLDKEKYHEKILDCAGADQFPPLIHQSSKINFAEYKQAVASGDTSYSEFVLLTCSFITDYEISLTIYDHYVMGNYSKAIQIILNTLNNEKICTQSEFNFIKDISQNLSPVNVHKAHERRFFEARLSRFTLIDKQIEKSIIKIANKLYNKKIISSHDLEAFLSLADFKDFIVSDYSEHFDDFRKINSQAKIKLKMPGTLGRKKKSIGDIEEPVASGNPSVMKSYSPAFMNEINQVRFYAKADTVGPENKSNAEEHVLYASSFSGHIIDFMGSLLCYLKQNKTDPQLSADVNNFILGIISLYMKKGYHTFWESAYIFFQPVVTEYLLKEYKCKIKLFFPESALSSAFIDAQEYAKHICLRKTLDKEISIAIKTVDALIESTPEKTDVEPSQPTLPMKPLRPIFDSKDEEEESSESEDDEWSFTSKSTSKPDFKKSAPMPMKTLPPKWALFKEVKLASTPYQASNPYKTILKLQSLIELKLAAWGGRKERLKGMTEDLDAKQKIAHGKRLLANQASKFGYKCHDVPGDGNCFFYAAAHQLEQHKMLDFGEVLREIIAIDILENKNEYNDFFLGREDLKKYAEDLMKSDAWADGYFAGKALARVSNTIVIIIINDDKTDPIIFKPAGATKRLVLGYETGRHYQSLILDPESTLTEDLLQKRIDAAPEIRPFRQQAFSTSSSSAASLSSSMPSSESTTTHSTSYRS